MSGWSAAVASTTSRSLADIAQRPPFGVGEDGLAGRRPLGRGNTLGGRRMARPDAGCRSRVLGLLFHHLFEETRNTVGPHAELLQQRHAGSVGFTLQGPPVP